MNHPINQFMYLCFVLGSLSNNLQALEKKTPTKSVSVSQGMLQRENFGKKAPSFWNGLKKFFRYSAFLNILSTCAGKETVLINNTTHHLNFLHPDNFSLARDPFLVPEISLTSKTVFPDLTKDLSITHQPRLLSTASPFDMRVNTHTDQEQTNPSIATLPNGDVVIVWSSYNPSLTAFEVRGQMYYADGTLKGSEILVSTAIYGGSDKIFPYVTGLPNGNFLVSWHGVNSADPNDTNPVLKWFKPDGTPLTPNEQTNVIPLKQFYPYAAPLNQWDAGKSGATVVWESDSAGQWVIGYGRFYESFTSNTIFTYSGTGQMGTPKVATLNNGDSFLIWSVWGAGASDGIYGQLWSHTGSTSGGVTTIQTGGGHTHPSVTALNTGGFVVVWQDASGLQIDGQLFDANGVPSGGVFTVHSSPGGVNQPSFPDGLSRPSITSLKAGDFVVTWSQIYSTYSTETIWAKTFSNNGTPRGGAFQVSFYFSTGPAAITPLTDGGFMVAYPGHFDNTPDIFVKRFNAESVNTPMEKRQCYPDFEKCDNTFFELYKPNVSSLCDRALEELFPKGSLNTTKDSYENFIDSLKLNQSQEISGLLNNLTQQEQDTIAAYLAILARLNQTNNTQNSTSNVQEITAGTVLAEALEKGSVAWSALVVGSFLSNEEVSMSAASTLNELVLSMYNLAFSLVAITTYRIFSDAIMDQNGDFFNDKIGTFKANVLHYDNEIHALNWMYWATIFAMGYTKDPQERALASDKYAKILLFQTLSLINGFLKPYKAKFLQSKFSQDGSFLDKVIHATDTFLSTGVASAITYALPSEKTNRSYPQELLGNISFFLFKSAALSIRKWLAVKIFKDIFPLFSAKTRTHYSVKYPELGKTSTFYLSDDALGKKLSKHARNNLFITPQLIRTQSDDGQFKYLLTSKRTYPEKELLNFSVHPLVEGQDIDQNIKPNKLRFKRTHHAAGDNTVLGFFISPNINQGDNLKLNTQLRDLTTKANLAWDVENPEEKLVFDPPTNQLFLAKYKNDLVKISVCDTAKHPKREITSKYIPLKSFATKPSAFKIFKSPIVQEAQDFEKARRKCTADQPLPLAVFVELIDTKENFMPQKQTHVWSVFWTLKTCFWPKRKSHTKDLLPRFSARKGKLPMKQNKNDFSMADASQLEDLVLHKK